MWYWLFNIKNKPEEAKNTAFLFDKWYELMDLEQFKLHFPINGEKGKKESEALFKEHNEWVNVTPLDKTPTIYINSFQFPEEYSIDDLFIFIPFLIEHFEGKNEKSAT